MPEKKENVLSIEELAAELVNRGGSIVRSADCPADELLEARRDNRFALADGVGFVLLVKEGFA